jgi:hypothetical protein
MGVWLTVVRPFAYPHRGDALGNNHFRHAVEMLVKALEPQLQVHAVSQDQLRFLRALDIPRRGLIFMDLGTRFGNGGDFCGIARHVFRHIGDNGKGGDNLELFSRLRACGGRGNDKRAEQQTLQSLQWVHRRWCYQAR